METLIVKTDTPANARYLAEFLKKVSIVKDVLVGKIDGKSSPPLIPPKGGQNIEKQDAEPYNWINPSRPATDEDFEQMISEAEAEYKAGLGMTTEEARGKTLKKIREWKEKNLK